MNPEPDDGPDEEEEEPGITPGRRAFRYGQIAVYAVIAVAIPAYMYSDGKMVGTMVVFTWLMAFYMAARALAIWVKFRQESRPPRYSRAYVTAADLFEKSDSTTPDSGNEPPKNGSSHG